jgi:hypothetical protein
MATAEKESKPLRSGQFVVYRVVENDHNEYLKTHMDRHGPDDKWTEHLPRAATVDDKKVAFRWALAEGNAAVAEIVSHKGKIFVMEG